MHYASAGVRSAARKGTNALVHQTGYNAPGGSAAANPTSRSIHIAGHAGAALHASPIPPVPTIPPRNPSHRLFSASKNFLQRFFTRLTAPGLRAPTYLSQAQTNGARSLHSTAIRGTTIQSGLSLPTQNALRNNALRRQANMFLPRSPGPVPPRFGGIAQVGLGTARNFSSARPLFQHLADNVPVVGRALYEIDWDLEMRKEHKRMRLMAAMDTKKAKAEKQTRMMPAHTMHKPNKVVGPDARNPTVQASVEEVNKEIEHYFEIAEVAPVTTYLFIPLAPTPTNRRPLPLDPVMLPTSSSEPTLLPPLPYLGALHASHSTHALRVSALFARLDQANVWSHRGVRCSSYSQGTSHQKLDENGIENQGVCTVLKVEFEGWTKGEVRAVIGESGTGWCALEEVIREECISDTEDPSDNDSLSSCLFEDGSVSDLDETFNAGVGRAGTETIDPAQSFVLPTLDFSSSFLSSQPLLSSGPQNTHRSVPLGMESDPWVVDEFSSSSSASSYSDVSDIIDSPSTNGWFDYDRVSERHLASTSSFENRQDPNMFLRP